MRDPKPPLVSPLTLTRRTVLDWLGSATVLALGGKVLAACAAVTGESDGGSLPAGDDGADGTGPDGGGDGGFGFRPGGGHVVYDEWPERTVDRQDIESILASWTLTVDGLVERPRTLTFAELVALPRLDLVMDFHCVEGWSVHDVPYSAVHLSTLLDLVGGARPEATHVGFHTIGGAYDGSLPIAVALEPHSMLAYGVGGATLPLAHGFPLRVAVPRLLAYKSPKYVTRVELTDRATTNYWERAGYPYDAEVPPGRLREGRY
jgi:hypothetical protein